ncbi:class V chitinase-like protein [Podospora didyma]|uniref:chitinase n=1 Tax=Podospora didyma TaxID=330526 RepID=A0AAE0U3N0_9PEZI|nr:class V chitinase-like protein [Podospora didyma]
MKPIISFICISSSASFADAFTIPHFRLPAWGKKILFQRGDCKTEIVAAGDGCGSLATKCGISPNDFTKYNPDPNLCSTLTPGELVCCSAGTIPDIRPKQLPNGTCASYVVEKDDTCSKIAAANGLHSSDIDEFNKVKTWGFNSCESGLMLGLKICVSDGNAPMPAPVNGSTCGPTKPGTAPPQLGSGQTIADLSPCPLDACCNIWAQCGISPEFCAPTHGTFGNPGTGPADSNGCVQNCGVDVVNNAAGPPGGSFISVGYYETWTMDRSCLRMPVSSLSKLTHSYTHIHWAFATLSTDLKPQINDPHNQWEDFKALNKSGIKRIVSLGGWGFSTDPSTYDRLRRATSPCQRNAFTDGVVKLVNDHGLDGVDFDWEYPGAIDVPGIPDGQMNDGDDYLAMLTVLKKKLPNHVTLSFAAPASYWYLQHFPLGKMSDTVDYITFMTYDLHGQWDYGNKWSQDGCPDGNCLRSHINLTETQWALSMITKAGVPSSKIAVGVSSYGRSFKMTEAGCSGPMCTYVGGNSAAKAGSCTNTPGYIANAEIDAIIQNGGNVKTWLDQDSHSDILVYEGTEWVAYMSEDTRQQRQALYKGLNFAGTVDWAVDLQKFV